MLKSEDLDIIGLYRSQDGDMRELIKILLTLMDKTKTIIIGGDLNVCALKAPNNIVTKTLTENRFKQIVKKATHIEGGILDHVYIYPDENERFAWVIEDFPKYYSDHDCIGVTLIKSEAKMDEK